MKLLLARHAQSEKAVGLNHFGTNNLTNIGILEAKQLGNFLLSQPLNAIYSSTASRARQTLDEILTNRPKNEGTLIHLTHFLAPKLKRESGPKLNIRVKIFLNDLLSDHNSDEIILVISHSQVLKSILKQLVAINQTLDHASLSIIDYSDKQAKLVTINQTSHLA